MRHRAATLAIVLGVFLPGAAGRTEPSGATLPTWQQPAVAGRLDMLASHEIDAPLLPDAAAAVTNGIGVTLHLERVSLAPGDTLDGRNPDNVDAAGRRLSLGGLHLLYVEVGEIVVDVGGGNESPFGEGEDALVPQDVREYTLRNETGRCASLLRLSVEHRGAMGAGPISAEGGPERAGPSCGEHAVLVEVLDGPSREEPARTGPWPASPPLHWFMARLIQEPQASFSPFGYTGPVAVLAESGSFTGLAGAVAYRVARDGGIGIPSGVRWSALAGSDGGVALVVGVVPAAEPLLAQGPSIPQSAPSGVEYVDFLDVGAVVVTVEGNVRLRDAATTRGNVVTELPTGTRLTVTGAPTEGPDDDYLWYPVADRRGGEGFVAGAFLEEPDAGGHV